MMVANGDLIMQEIIIYGSVAIKAERSKYKVLTSHLKNKTVYENNLIAKVPRKKKRKLVIFQKIE